MDLRWQLIASLLRRGSQSINLGQWGEGVVGLARKCFRGHYIRMKCICFFRPLRAFSCAKRLFGGILRLCGTRSYYGRWGGLIANALKLRRFFRSTWVDGYAVPKENKALRSLLMFVAGTDQC